MKRAALPERTDAVDDTRIVEVEHVIGHALDGPHHRCLMIDHEDLARDDLDPPVPSHLSIPELPDLAVAAAYRCADGVLLGSVGRERSEPCLSVASSPTGRVCADHRLQPPPLGRFSDLSPPNV